MKRRRNKKENFDTVASINGDEGEIRPIRPESIFKEIVKIGFKSFKFIFFSDQSRLVDDLAKSLRNMQGKLEEDRPDHKGYIEIKDTPDIHKN